MDPHQAYRNTECLNKNMLGSFSIIISVVSQKLTALEEGSCLISFHIALTFSLCRALDGSCCTSPCCGCIRSDTFWRMDVAPKKQTLTLELPSFFTVLKWQKSVKWQKCGKQLQGSLGHCWNDYCRLKEWGKGQLASFTVNIINNLLCQGETHSGDTFLVWQGEVG